MRISHGRPCEQMSAMNIKTGQKLSQKRKDRDQKAPLRLTTRSLPRTSAEVVEAACRRRASAFYLIATIAHHVIGLVAHNA